MRHRLTRWVRCTRLHVRDAVRNAMSIVEVPQRTRAPGHVLGIAPVLDLLQSELALTHRTMRFTRTGARGGRCPVIHDPLSRAPAGDRWCSAFVIVRYSHGRHRTTSLQFQRNKQRSRWRTRKRMQRVRTPPALFATLEIRNVESSPASESTSLRVGPNNRVQGMTHRPPHRFDSFPCQSA